MYTEQEHFTKAINHLIDCSHARLHGAIVDMVAVNRRTGVLNIAYEIGNNFKVDALTDLDKEELMHQIRRYLE